MLDLHNTMMALTMQLHADDPISDESAYLTRDDPNYSSAPQGTTDPIVNSNSRPRRTVASYETLSPTRNPPILYYYSDDDDNEEQSTDHRDDIDETVIPSSLTADTIPEEDEEMESSVDSKPIVAERRFYFMESCLTTQQMAHICVHIRPEFLERLRFESVTEGRQRPYVALSQEDFDEHLLEASEIIDEVTRVYRELKGGHPKSKRRMLIRRYMRLLHHKRFENPTPEWLQTFNEQEWEETITNTFDDPPVSAVINNEIPEPEHIP
jgi:hypothetical protein